MATSEEIINEACKPLQWFKHDIGAAYDEKCQKLLLVGGYEAYGRFWRLVELMAGKPGHRYDLNDVLELKLLANDLKFDDTDDLKDFLDTLSRLELISSEQLADNIVMSERLWNNALSSGAKRVGAREGAKKTNQARKEKAQAKLRVVG